MIVNRWIELGIFAVMIEALRGEEGRDGRDGWLVGWQRVRAAAEGADTDKRQWRSEKKG